MTSKKKNVRFLLPNMKYLV